MRWRRKALRSAWLVLGVVCLVPLFGVGPAQSQEITTSLQTIAPHRHRLEGHFRVTASRQTVWDVLTDYDHIPQFVPSMRQSKVVEHRPHGALVQQEALARLWIFYRTVDISLEVIEQPMSRISFEDIWHRDFYLYKGDWEIRGSGQDLEVVYRLELKRRFAAPNFIVRRALEKNSTALLTEVRAEILRRANAPR